MRNLLLFCLILSLLPGLVSCTGGAPAAGQVITSTPARQHTISVTGNAEVLVIPDEVDLTLGVETWNKSLEEARTQNDQIVKAVLEIAQSHGVEEKNIQTDFIQIQPRYDDYAQRQFIGYFVRKTVVIKLKDITKFEDLLAAALEAGVNYIHGIEFRTSELRKYKDEARALALKAAQEKATAMAKELGQEISQPISIREEWSQWWSPYNSWWGYGGMPASQNVVQNAGGTSPQTEGGISAGQISVSASVAVEFELK